MLGLARARSHNHIPEAARGGKQFLEPAEAAAAERITQQSSSFQ